ncbi:MAG: glutamine synthetase, partial [bacterium]
TFFEGSKPLGFPNGGYPAPQGHYYCGIGADEVFGRNIVEEHMKYCLNIGIMFEGINAEVMPGQWEFQIGAGDPISVSDDLWIARYLLYRTAEKYSINATLEPKPVRGDLNGAGAHTNFSTKEMRKNYDAIELAVDKLSKKHPEHIEIYGEDNHLRLTGKHETCSIEQFRSGVSNRGASIRIPWHVSKERKGYIEDRRPAANMDPYLVTRKIIETVCE